MNTLADIYLNHVYREYFPVLRLVKDDEDGVIELNMDSEEAIRLENCIIYV